MNLIFITIILKRLKVTNILKAAGGRLQASGFRPQASGFRQR
jgi:hypothetical protein